MTIPETDESSLLTLKRLTEPLSSELPYGAYPFQTFKLLIFILPEYLEHAGRYKSHNVAKDCTFLTRETCIV